MFNKIESIALNRIEKTPILQKSLNFLFPKDENGIIVPAKTAWQLLKTSSMLMLAGVISGLIIPGLKMGWVFGEGDIMTWISVIALFSIGLISNKIWLIRQTSIKADVDIKVWRILSILFTFLALDDLLRIHETIDRQIHHLLGIKPTSLTDHLDDAIIALYGVFGLIVLIRHRKELFKYLSTLKYFCAAGICTIATVVLDFTASSKAFIQQIFATPYVQLTIDILDVLEEWFKIYADIFFVVTFLAVLSTATIALKGENPNRSGPMSNV